MGAWTDEMQPIVPASKALASSPVMIGVAADSGCGKSTFLRRILGALGTEVKPGHTAVGGMMTVICLDDYHINDRAGRKVTGFTDPPELIEPNKVMVIEGLHPLMDKGVRETL